MMDKELLVMQLLYGNEGAGTAEFHYKAYDDREFLLIVMRDITFVLENIEGEYKLLNVLSSYERAMCWLVCVCMEGRNED